MSVISVNRGRRRFALAVAGLAAGDAQERYLAARS